MKVRPILLAAVSVVALCCAGAAVSLWLPHSDSGPAAGSAPLQTVLVERTTLSANLILSAQLEYAAPTTLVGGTGILTKLPHPGDFIATGQPLFEVDGRSVLSFAGERPLWRPIESGMSDGPDVQEIEQNLANLGFGENLTVDNRFTAITERAITAWQKSMGRERTGVIALGDVVMVSGASVRVNAVTALVGASATGPVLSYTEPGIHGRIRLTADQQTQLVPGMAVSVRLPGGSETPATIGAVDPGGAPTADPAKTTPPSARVDFPDDAVVQGIGLPSLRVTVGIEDAADVLVVPVTALSARPGGGYAVQIERAGGVLLSVPVELGLIADSRAEVTGGDLAEGDRVVIAG